MHQLLETYLRRVKARLKSLPAQEQQQHIQEIEEHLRRLITDMRAIGLTEKEAVESALRQFGKPARVGRAIEQAGFGAKTGLVKGFFLGAALGTLLLALPIIGLALAGAGFFGSGFGNWEQYLLTAAVGGGIASFVGRRFTRRYLTRPARLLPIFTWASQSLTVGTRFMGVGVLRGAVGGALFGAINMALMLHDPHSTVFSVREMVTDLVALTVGCCIDGALIVGFLGALVGIVLGAVHRSPSKRQQV